MNKNIVTASLSTFFPDLMETSRFSYQKSSHVTHVKKMPLSQSNAVSMRTDGTVSTGQDPPHVPTP